MDLLRFLLLRRGASSASSSVCSQPACLFRNLWRLLPEAVCLLAVLGGAAAAQSTAPTSGNVTVNSGVAQILGTGSTAIGYTPIAPSSVATVNANYMAIDSAGNIYLANKNAGGGPIVFEISASTGMAFAVAGGGSTVPSPGSTIAASSASLGSAPAGMVCDAAGNLYVIDSTNYRIDKITGLNGTGTPQITALNTGNNSSYALVGSSFTTAATTRFLVLGGITIDSSGNLWVAGESDQLLEITNLSTTPMVKDFGTQTYTGLTTPTTTAEALTSAQFNLSGLVFDGSGNLYAADYNQNLVYEITGLSGSSPQIMVTAGGGSNTPSGSTSAVSPTSIKLNEPTGLGMDSSGNLYIADTFNSVLEKITSPGTGGASLSSVFGGTTRISSTPQLYSAVAAAYVNDVKFDSAGNIYMIDSSNSGGGLARTGVLAVPPYVAVGSSDATGVLVSLGASTTLSSITSSNSTEFTVGTVTGCTVNGSTVNTSGTICAIPITFKPAYPGQRQAAIQLYSSSGVLFGTVGITGNGVGAIVSIAPGTITTIAGGGSSPSTCTGHTDGFGDGCTATNAGLHLPAGTAMDSAGNLYIADYLANRIRKVSAATGIITTVAGNGTGGYSGDNSAATGAELALPNGVAVDAAGNLYIVDEANNVIRKVSAATGIITTVAGNGTAGYNGDNIAATSAEMGPYGMTVDAAGNLYIADAYNNLIRKVSAATGIITTVAGNGTASYNGDNIAATSAELYVPASVAVDAAGNLYIADNNNQRIREVSAATGIITTVAGNGTGGYNGDNASATSAELYYPAGITVDAAGNLYIADQDSKRIRKVTAATGIITTVAGSGAAGYSGDNGPATSAKLYLPNGAAVDAAGNLYIADQSNNVIRKVTATAANVPFATSTPVGSTDTTDYTSGVDTLTLYNNGNGPLTISAVTAASSFPFVTPAYTPQCAIGTVAAGASCYLGAEFQPLSGGSLSQASTVSDNTVIGTESISVTGTAQVGTTPQYITFPQPASPVAYSSGATETMSAASYATSNNAATGLAITYSVTGPATVSGSTVTFTGTGVVAITASQVGSATYAAATSVTVYVTANVPSTAVSATSATQTITLTSTAAGSVAHVNALTTGISGLDFAVVTGGTCTTSTVFTAAGQTCTVEYSFTPSAPGLRMGAITLTTSTPTVLATAYISGTGVASLTDYTPGTLSAIVGVRNSSSYGGDNNPAISANLFGPYSVVLDAAGNQYIADTGNNRIRKVTKSSGNITTIAGGGSSPTTCSGHTDSSGDGCAATQATLTNPYAVAVDGAGNIYITDTNDTVVRKVNATTGIITVVAGNGSYCTTPTGATACGDGGAATSANLATPIGLAVDAAGNIFIGDASDARVREVNAATGLISTVAGNGNAANTGDNGAATSAKIQGQLFLTVDAYDNIYIGTYAPSLRMVYEGGSAAACLIEATNASIFGGCGASNTSAPVAGNIYTIAGNGTYCTGTCGDGGLATGSTLNAAPGQPAVDPAGNVYLTSSSNVRRISAATGIISTVEGNYTGGGTQSGNALKALLDVPAAVALDGSGNIYIVDTGFAQVFEVTATAYPVTFPTTTPTGTLDTADGTQTVGLTNIGNSSLTFNVPGSGTNPSTNGGFGLLSSFTYPTGFSSACSTLTTSSTTGTGALASGGNCAYGITFTPASGGTVNSSIVVTDNSNAATAATQSIAVSGTGVAVPVLSIASAHTGSFYQGQTGATYTLTVTNTGTASTNGTITVTDTVPSGLTITAMSGGVWFCNVGTATCTTNSTLGNGQNTFITVTVSVASNATSPLVNSVSVSGGGSSSASNTDSTTIVQLNAVVNTLTDDATGTASNCAVGNSNTCTLRDAIALATANATSTYPASITFSVSGTITLSNGVLTLPSYTTITGTTTGSAGTLAYNNIISGGGTQQIFAYGGTGSSLSTLALQNGKSGTGSLTSYGGAITLTGTGTLSISNCLFSGNNAVYGGAVAVNGNATPTPSVTVTINSSIFNLNTATQYGGAIAIYGSSTMNINNSTVMGDGSTSLASYGGGLYIYAGTVNIVDSTFSGLVSTIIAGAIYGGSSSPVVNMTNTTVSGNRSNVFGGIYVQNGTYSLKNSIVEGNTVLATNYPDMNAGSATFSSTSGSFYNTSQTVTTNPMLAPLGYYGGNGFNANLETMLPLPGSPVVCFSSYASLANGTTTDERGYANYITNSSSKCVDAGAVQSNYSGTWTTPSGVVSGTSFTPTVTLKENGNALSFGGAQTISEPLSLTATSGSLSGSLTSLSTAGVATGSAVITGANSGDTLTAYTASSSMALGQNTFISSSFTVAANTTQLAFGTSPTASITAGGNGGSAITVLEQSSGGATVTTASDTITLTITDSGNNTIYTKTAAASSGVATFNLSGGSYNLTTAGSYTYTTSLTGVTSATAGETVTAGTATKISLSAPSSSTAGASISVTVTAQDQYNNAASYTHAISFTSGDSAAVLPSSGTLTNSGTYSVTLKTAGSQSITANAGSGAFTASASVTVSAAALSGFVVLPGLNPTYVGYATPFNVTPVDAYGNFVSSYTGTVNITTNATGDTISPTSYTFTGTGAAHANATFTITGNPVITATDSVSSSLTGSSGIVVGAAPTYAVTTTTDDATGISGNCPGVSCSLRDAVAAVNTFTATYPGTTPSITMPANSYGLSNGGLTLTGNANISNSSTTTVVTLTWNSSASTPMLTISSGVKASITGIEFLNANNTGGNGGAVSNAGTLTLTQVYLLNNSAANGGGIYNTGTLTVSRSTFYLNSATADGGGIYTTNGNVTIANSELLGNSATTAGGAIYVNITGGNTTLYSTTITNNSSTNGTGGVDGVVVTNPIIAYFSLTAFNTVIAGNTGKSGSAPDVHGGSPSGSNNLINLTPSAYTTQLLISATPGNYGGLVPVALPLPGGPLIAAGSATATGVAALDERGQARTIGTTPTIDIGAVESNYSLAFSQQPPSSFVQSITISPAVTVQFDDFGAAESVSGLSIAMSMPSDATSLSGTPTASTNSSGLASFSNLSVTNVEPSTTTLKAALGSALSVTSSTFTVTAAVAKLGFGTSPAASITAGGNGGSAITVQEQNSSGVTQTSASDTITLTITDSGNNTIYTKTAAASSGVATFNLSGGSYNLTTVGSYTYTASFGTLTSATASETVVPASLASLTVAGYPSNPNVYSSNTLTVTAKDTYGNLATNFTGSVTITSSDSAATLPSTYFFTSGASGDNGVHTFSVALNTAGTQSITATSGSTTGSQTGISVQKVTPAVTWIPGTNTITYPATLNGLLNATAAYSGNNDSGTPTYTATPSGGSASTVTSSSILTPGTYALAVSFASGTNFNTGTGSVSTFTVNKSTGASISAGSITQTYGTATNETATVNGATFGATPTGNISYSFDSGTATNATLSSGSYSIPVSATLAGGSHTLYISYAGDSNYSGSGVNKTVNFTISTAAPTLGATAVTQTYGTATSTTLSVTGVNGAATPTGTITYSLNGGAGTTVALSGGSYTLQLSATLTGSNTVSFTYGGDTNYSSVTTAKTVNWTVGTIAPTLSGSTVTQTYGTAASVTLSVSGSGVTPTGSITYSLNGGTAATVSLASGSYMLALPATLSAGSNSVSFTYGGDSNYSAVTTAKVVNWTVAQATPTISGSAVTQTYGTATTSTVTVAAVGSGATPAGTITYSIDGGTAQVLTLSGGQASVPIGATLTVGLHNLALTYSGNTSYNGITSGTGTTLSWTVSQATQSISFTAPASPVTYGVSPIALTATGGGSSNAVIFTIDGSSTGTGTISGSTLTVTGVGTIVIDANQAGNTNYSAASQVQRSIVVNKATATEGGAAVTQAYGTSAGSTVTVTGVSGGATPTGTITYTIDSGTAQTLTLVGGSVSVPVPATLTATSHTIALTYSGDGNYSAITTGTPVSWTTSKATLTVTTNAATMTYGSSLPTLSGTIAGMVTGDGITATYTTTAISSSPVNVAGYPITATLNDPGAKLGNYTVVNNGSTLTITKASSGAALALSSTSITPNQQLTLTATITDASSGSAGTPTGTVNFFDGSTQLNTTPVALTGGVATFNISTLASGSHSLTVTYAGDTNFTGSSSTATAGTTVSVGQLEFTFQASSSATTVTVVPGNSASFPLTITPLYGAFPSTVTFSLTGLPAGYTYSFTPASLPANTAAATTVTLTINVPVNSSANRAPQGNGSYLSIALGLLLLPFALGRRRYRAALLAVLLLLGAGATLLTGCGAGNGIQSVQPHSYNLTVTATSGAVSHTTNLTLNVQ